MKRLFSCILHDFQGTRLESTSLWVETWGNHSMEVFNRISRASKPGFQDLICG